MFLVRTTPNPLLFINIFMDTKFNAMVKFSTQYFCEII